MTDNEKIDLWTNFINNLKENGEQMTAKERLIEAIERDLEEAQDEAFHFEGKNDVLYAFNKGRSFAHNYDLLVINRLLKEEKENEQ